MGVMTDITTVAANTTSGNILAGKIEEFLQRPSAVQIAPVAAAVGIFMTCHIGGRLVIDDQQISGANRFPLLPDDVLAEGGGAAGERIFIRLRNSTGAGIAVTTKINTTPVA